MAPTRSHNIEPLVGHGHGRKKTPRGLPPGEVDLVLRLRASKKYCLGYSYSENDRNIQALSQISQALTKNANYPLGRKTWLQPLECYLFHVAQVILHFLRRTLICHTIATERSGQVTHRNVQLLMVGE